MKHVMLGAAALVLAGCVHVSHTESAANSPALMSTAEAMAITQAGNDQFGAYFLVDDAAGVASLHTTTATIFPPEAPNVQGREAITAYWEAGTAALYRIELITQTAEAVSPTDIVEEVRATFFDPEGKAIGGGKAVVHWKLEDGAWLIHRDIWNAGP